VVALADDTVGSVGQVGAAVGGVGSDGRSEIQMPEDVREVPDAGRGTSGRPHSPGRNGILQVMKF